MPSLCPPGTHLGSVHTRQEQQQLSYIHTPASLTPSPQTEAQTQPRLAAKLRPSCLPWLTGLRHPATSVLVSEVLAEEVAEEALCNASMFPGWPGMERDSPCPAAWHRRMHATTAQGLVEPD